MKTFDAPEWMIEPFLKQGVLESDYYLYGAGRALAFVRMAAHTLDALSDDQKIAEYHAYAGISAARTAIDATAVWLNVRLQLGVKQGPEINLSRKDFWKKASKALSESQKELVLLGELGGVIDEYRQRAQHREGLAIARRLPSENLGHAGGWYLMPNGLSGDRAEDVHLVGILVGWADGIESNLREIHNLVKGGR